MVSLNQLPKIKAKSKKRVGRGYGSGKGGHTSGRGQKGQKTRGKMGLLFEGTKLRKSLVRRLPIVRGKNRFKPNQTSPIIVNLEVLNLLPKDSEVTTDLLIKKGIVKQRDVDQFGIKILGGGELKIPLKVRLSCSKSAEEKIKQAGGKVIGQPDQEK